MSSTTVTREMINAAHDVTMKNGIVLSHKLLKKIYLSMDSLANRLETSGSPLTEKYNELLMAVAKKFSEESRHETALRYIREAESRSDCAAAIRARAEK